MIKQITQKLQSCLCFIFNAAFVSSERTRTINSEIYREDEFDKVRDQKSYFRYQISILRYQQLQSVIGAYTDASAIRHPILLREKNKSMHAKAACLHADLNNDQFTKVKSLPSTWK